MSEVNQDAIFGPFFATLILTILVWFYMYSQRLPFLESYKQKNDLKSNEAMNESLKNGLDSVSPPHVKYPSENLKNLFEIPPLFYVMVVYLYVTKNVDGIHVGAAWVFAIFRWLHSVVQCTFNKILLRFGLYVVSTMALWFMVLRAAWSHFGQ